MCTHSFTPQKSLSEYYHSRNKTGVLIPHGTGYWKGSTAALEIWNKFSTGWPITKENIQKAVINHLVTTLSRTYFNIDNFAAYGAVAHSVRDMLIRNWNETQQLHTSKDVKRVYYLSLEFLLGRSLDCALLNLGVKSSFNSAMNELAFNMEDLLEQESDPALGNGGLGRLAACFMDSLATLNYPAWGYGLRYEFGIFKQEIVQGHQCEVPDYWLNFENPWEVPRIDVTYEVRFYGQIRRCTRADGAIAYDWIGGETVQAVAYDVPIPGYKTKSTINIRLWSSKPTKRFDLKSFNEGEYAKSLEDQQKAENITSVLYPNDSTPAGKELRLKQQYFFVAASLMDIIRRFKKAHHSWDEFPEKVAVQLNDTHPALSIPELQRILIDQEGLHWDHAWHIVTRVFSFTNHTVLPEALEKWPFEMLHLLLPRHLQIVLDINLFFLQSVERLFPADRERLARMSLVEEHPYKMIRMAHLAVVGSHKVNGVARIHSELIQKELFGDFVHFYGAQKFTNITNGITQRRWICSANPILSKLISDVLGGDEKWITQLSELKRLDEFKGDPQFRERWALAKLQNKQRLSEWIEEQLGVKISPKMLFDIQVKRIHEYKRQLMNILYVIYRYLGLKERPRTDLFVPRFVIFGGKAAPGYQMAKLTIKLINDVANIINNDLETCDMLSLIFVPNYNVSIAELLIPASDISQHISTAGTEASGTSNMKFVLNGGLILGTMDGANVEICNLVGKENIFTFGCSAEKVSDLRHQQRFHGTMIGDRLATVIHALQSGLFGDYETIAPLIETITIGGDFYLVAQDFDSYVEAQQRVDEAFRDADGWIEKSIANTSSVGFFSSDRAIKQYAEDIWNIHPCNSFSAE